MVQVIDNSHMHQWLEEALVGKRTCVECGMVVTFDHREENMASVNDWAAKAAAKICDEFPMNHDYDNPSSERIAAIIATFAEPLVTLLKESRRSHLHCDDSFYCCPRCTSTDHSSAILNEPCTCGADKWNKKVDEVLNG